MSKYTKEEQIAIVEQAMNLTSAIQADIVELDILKSQRFRNLPNAPIRKIAEQPREPIKPQYPTPPRYTVTFEQFFEQDVKNNPTIINNIFSNHPFIRAIIISVIIGIISLFISMISMLIPIQILGSILLGSNILIVMLGFIILPFSVVYYITKRESYNKKCDEMNRLLANTPEYLQARADAERLAKERQIELNNKVQERQASYDLEYENEKKHYDTVILPQYNNDRLLWDAMHQTKMNIISDCITDNEKALKELYDTTGLISVYIRNLEYLTWIYNDMCSSEHDIERATDLLLANELLAKADENIAAVQAQTNVMQQELNKVLATLEAGNYIMQDGNYIMQEGLSDIKQQLVNNRRHMDVGFIISGVQSHNISRRLQAKGSKG